MGKIVFEMVEWTRIATFYTKQAEKSGTKPLISCHSHHGISNGWCYQQHEMFSTWQMGKKAQKSSHRIFHHGLLYKVSKKTLQSRPDTKGIWSQFSLQRYNGYSMPDVSHQSSLMIGHERDSRTQLSCEKPLLQQHAWPRIVAKQNSITDNNKSENSLWSGHSPYTASVVCVKVHRNKHMAHHIQ